MAICLALVPVPMQFAEQATMAWANGPAKFGALGDQISEQRQGTELLFWDFQREREVLEERRQQARTLSIMLQVSWHWPEPVLMNLVRFAHEAGRAIPVMNITMRLPSFVDMWDEPSEDPVVDERSSALQLQKELKLNQGAWDLFEKVQDQRRRIERCICAQLRG